MTNQVIVWFQFWGIVLQLLTYSLSFSKVESLRVLQSQLNNDNDIKEQLLGIG
jgi:hypothetical protein